MNDKYVDIIIPAYNPGTFLDEAIQSALSQTHDNINIIVVDDNSSEDVESIVKKYSNIKYIRNEKNLGPAASRNVGIKSSDAPYVSLLDADDIWYNHKLELSLDSFNKNPEIGMTCGNYHVLLNRRRLSKPFYSRPIKITWEKMMRQNFIASGSTTIKRDVLESIGLFDEELWISEDYDCWIKISENYPIHYIHRPLYKYSVIPSGNSLTNNSNILKNQDKNILQIRNNSKDRVRKKILLK
jgi:glycosyltransferase involved in cell wall biosynthesis